MSLAQQLAVPALVAAMPVSLTEQRDEVRALLQRSRRDLMSVSRAVHALQQRWQQEGRPGGSFDRWLGGETGEFEEHAVIQDRLRSGEAQAQGIVAPNDTQARNAGVMLRRLADEGVPLAQATEQVQQAAAEGQLKRARNPSAPAGCTHVYLPTSAAPQLDLVRARLRALEGGEAGGEAAPGAPEEVAQLVSIVGALPDEVLALYRDGRGDEVAWLPADELQRIYDLLDEARVSATDTAGER